MKNAILKNGKIEIIDVPIPALNGKKGAIVKVFGCGLCGSDIVKINHNSENAVLGHEIIGEIIELNTEIIGNGADEPFKIGDVIGMGHHYPCFKCKYCKNDHHSMCETFKNSNITPGGFSEFIFINEEHLKNTVFKKPDNLSYEEFSFLEPLACCLRAIRRADIKNSSCNCLVIGLGSIGILMAQGLKAQGINTFGFDINKERQKFIEFNPDIKYDVIFMTSGADKALQTAFDLIDKGGKIVVFSSIPSDLGYKNNEIYYKELSIIGSYSPAPCDLLLSSKFLGDKKVITTGLSVEYSLLDLEKAINDTKQGKILKGYIKL